MLRHPLCLITLLLFLAGCGSGSFIGNRFDNFTAYYNKFYNARKVFNEAAKSLETKNQPVDRDRYLPLFSNPGPAANTKGFEDAIKKSADVLRDHSSSKWIDDALLLIGKAYFYQQNYVGAEQKFREVLTLESALEDEARFWLARTLIASHLYDQAIRHLQESLDQQELSLRWKSVLRLALGELYVKRGQWEEAAAELEQGLERVRDADLAARAQFLLGQVYETTGDYSKAVEAYERVQRYRPLYELAYAASVSAVRVEGLHGDPLRALQALRRLERDGKNYSNRAELAYLRARLLQAQQRAPEAVALYDALLYESDADISAVRGRIHYRLGELFRDVDEDYLLAAAHFDTAATALAQPARTGAAGGAAQEAFTPEAITDSREQADMFGLFARVRGEISTMDSLLHLGSLDDEAFLEAVQRLRRQRAEELAAQQRELNRRQTEQRFTGEGVFSDREDQDQFSDQENQAAPAAAAPEGGGRGAGFLFHKDPVRVQEGRLSFINRWGERPLVPNWRRVAAIDALTASAASRDSSLEGTSLRGLDPGGEDAALPQVDLSGVPRDPERQAQMRAERAMARYELANVLFLSMNRPDSAAAWYRRVIDEDADQPVAQRAYYALAEVHRSLGDSLAARRLYQQILQNYPDSDFAGRVHERLGLEVARPVRKDSLAMAEEAYKLAYHAWQRRRYTEALTRMLEVAADYRETPVAPRALFAAASIYSEWAARDSLDLFEALPVVLPDSLLRACGLLGVPATAEHTARPDTVLADTALTSAAPPDTALADTAPPDTALAGVTLALATDTLETDPPLDQAPDTLGAAADTLRLASRSVEGLGAPLTAPQGSTASLHLETLYASIADQYPQSPYADRARLVLQALEERRPVPVPDSTALAAVPADTAAMEPDTAAVFAVTEPDTAAAEPALPEEQLEAEERPPAPPPDAPAQKPEAGAESLDLARLKEQEHRQRLEEEQRLTREPVPAGRRPVLHDSTAAGRPAVEETVAAPTTPPAGAAQEALAAQHAAMYASVRGAGGIDRAAGGFTLVLASSPERSVPEAVLAPFREQGYRTDLLTYTKDGVTSYRAAFGQFKTASEAADVRNHFGDQLPEGTWVLQIQPDM